MLWRGRVLHDFDSEYLKSSGGAHSGCSQHQTLSDIIKCVNRSVLVSSGLTASSEYGAVETRAGSPLRRWRSTPCGKS